MSSRTIEFSTDEEYSSEEEHSDEELSVEEYKELVNTRIDEAMHDYASALNEYCKDKSLLLCESLKHEDLCNFLLELLN